MAILVIFGIFVLIHSSSPKSPVVMNKDGCMITGCSSQICSDQEVITTCEAIPGDECYKNVTCERQQNGECGWTQTSQLTQCLQDAEAKQTMIDTSTSSTSLTAGWQTYRNEEFGFEVRYPAYYEKYDEYDQGVYRDVGFGYSQGDYSNNMFISVFDDVFENFEINHRGGDTDILFRFDAMRKQWLASPGFLREGEEREWVPVGENGAIQKVEGLPFEAYTHTGGPGPIGCVGEGAVIPHPSYSFVVSIYSDKCLNDITIDDPKDGPLSSIGVDQILSTFRFAPTTIHTTS